MHRQSDFHDSHVQDLLRQAKLACEEGPSGYLRLRRAVSPTERGSEKHIITGVHLCATQAVQEKPRGHVNTTDCTCLERLKGLWTPTGGDDD
jgi:hypothetical protein